MRISQMGLMAIAIAGLALASPLPVYAGDHQHPTDQSDTAPDPHQITGQHVEGHIAFLHAELGITPGQEQLWLPVADAMRQDVQAMRDAQGQVARQSHEHESAVQYLQNRVVFANLRADGEVRFLNALQPLYAAMSRKQKQAADELLVPTDSDQ
jgi:hypothetical protein